MAVGQRTKRKAGELMGLLMGRGPDVQMRLFSATLLVPVRFLRPGALAQLGVALDKAPQSSHELAGEFARSGMPASWLAPARLAGRAIAVTL